MKKILSFVMVLLVVIPLTMLTVFTPTSTVPTEAEISQAIDLGMQWLAAQQNTTDGSWGTLNQVGKTGFAVLKFETHAVGMGENPLDPTYEYYDQVRDGLDYIFANANTTEISMQPAGDPDTDGDGFGVYFGSDFMPVCRTYETGIAMMAIAASTHPEMVVDVLGSSVDGWTYEDVLQDAVDYLAFGQTDAGDGRGGWIYEEIDNGTSMSDNSNTGYAVLGLAYAEAPPPCGFALTIPAFAKSELNVWIDYIQNDPGPSDDDGEVDPDGGSGYSAPNDWVNILKTGHLLCEMVFVGDTRTTQRVVDAVDYVVRHWNDTDVDLGWKGSPAENASYQAMYTTMAGLEALGIDGIDGIDWFDEFSDVLVAQQNPDGSWPPCIWDDEEQILATEWALLTLEKVAPPIPIDWWPMFHHDLSHTGYSTSKAPNTNNTIWSYTTGDDVFSSPAVVHGKVYVGSGDHNVYCLNASTGDFVWNYTTGEWVDSSPAVADGKVYVGSHDNNTYCLNASTGAHIWNYTTGEWVDWFSSPAVADGKVYVGSSDANVYCLNASTGDFIWNYTTGEWVDSSPAVAYGKVYVGSGDSNVYCLNASTGDFIWNYTTGEPVFSSPAVADGKVYVGSMDRNVYCLNASTGDFIWNYTTGSSVLSSPAVADGKVYVGSEDGKVYAFGRARMALYAGGSDPGVVYQYAGGTQWNIVSPNLGDAVLCLCEYEGHLYAGTVSNGEMGEKGRVWRYDGGTVWTLVGDNMDDRMLSLVVFKGDLYAGTGFVAGRLYRYEGGTTWTMVVDYTREVGDPPTGWIGFWSLYVWNDILYIGDAGYDLFGHYDGTNFTYDADLGGSCIWDFEVYDNNLYASAFVGRVHRSSDGTTWTTIRDYQPYDSWELETFQGYLHVTTGPKLERYDGVNFDLVWTEPRGNETISMINTGDNLVLGTGIAGYGGPGVGRVYTFDGTQAHLISDDMGSGIQALLGGLPLLEHDVACTVEAPAFLEPGGSTLLNATVYNTGLTDETFVELQLLINGTIVDSVVIPELLTDSSYTLSYFWTPTVKGIYDVIAYAPPVLGETFTPNNVASKIVQVYIHDVAVVDVTLSKTVVGQGYYMNITVTVENQGDMPETFNVITHYDELAVPTPEQWEAFCRMGDVNRDGYIDQADVDLISFWWGSSVPPAPPECDLDGDGDVGPQDLVICALGFGLDIWTYFGLGPAPTGMRAQRVVELFPGNQTTLIFTWNTTDVPYGNYTISATAKTVLGETDTGDNTYTDGWVVVTVAGDVNGNGVVDASDLFYLSKIHGSKPGDPDWNPNCDINGDSKVDVSDLSDLSRNYGKTI